MYLSRIKLNTDRNDTMRAIASPQILHASIEKCLNNDIKSRSLWRLDFLRENLYLLILSASPPCFDDFAKQFCTENESGVTKPYAQIISGIKEGRHFRFRLKGNTVHSVTGEKGVRGKVLPHVTEVHKKQWLVKKSAANGFVIADNSFELIEAGKQKFWRQSKQVEITYGVFEGVLEVEDATLFVKALTQGIGRAKAYGCGLITIMSVK